MNFPEYGNAYMYKTLQNGIQLQGLFYSHFRFMAECRPVSDSKHMQKGHSPRWI